MPQVSLSSEKASAVERVITAFARETEVEAVMVCDMGGNVIAMKASANDKPYTNLAALAAAALAATGELASIIGEKEFRSISHRGRSNGILIQALSGEYFILVILGKDSVEGMVRLLLRNIESQLSSILTGKGSPGSDDLASESFEIQEKSSGQTKTG